MSKKRTGSTKGKRLIDSRGETVFAHICEHPGFPNPDAMNLGYGEGCSDRKPQPKAPAVRDVGSVRRETIGKTGMTKNECTDLVSLLKIAGETNRMQILLYLFEDDRTHEEIVNFLYGTRRSSLTWHLSLMRVVGFLDSWRRGLAVVYGLTPKGNRVAAMIRQIL